MPKRVTQPDGDPSCPECFPGTETLEPPREVLLASLCTRHRTEERKS